MNKKRLFWITFDLDASISGGLQFSGIDSMTVVEKYPRVEVEGGIFVYTDFYQVLGSQKIFSEMANSKTIGDAYKKYPQTLYKVDIIKKYLKGARDE